MTPPPIIYIHDKVKNIFILQVRYYIHQIIVLQGEITTIKELILTHPHAKNKERNPCKFDTVAVLIINDGNNMDQFYNIKDIVKGSINKFILYQIGIIRVNGVENSTMRSSKRRLLCEMGWFQPPQLILYLFLFPHIRKQSWIIGLKSLSLGFLFIFVYWS